MNADVNSLSRTARDAVRSGNWALINSCAKKILKQHPASAEGHFLLGLGQKATGKPDSAVKSFKRAILSDAGRYDAGIELASVYMAIAEYSAALALLNQFESSLAGSPMYLDIAANLYSRLGHHSMAKKLFLRASELQPNIDRFSASLAQSYVYLGNTNAAIAIYETLIRKNPAHRRNHFELARLKKARDNTHIDQMLTLVSTTRPTDNIFLYYAIGKEFEDLGKWQQAFHYYQLAGEIVTTSSDYQVSSDVHLIDKVIEVCNLEWLQKAEAHPTPQNHQPVPIFIVGLPRSGTTLVDRIISSHSEVESIDETFYLQAAIRQAAKSKDAGAMTEKTLIAASRVDPKLIREAYFKSIEHRLDHRNYFIEKLPENFTYLGYITKAFPEAKIVCLDRNPLDVCFALFKQSFFRYAYNLADLSAYYIAFRKLKDHWQTSLSEKIIEVSYEELVSDQETVTRRLLNQLGLEFQVACVNFDKNTNPTSSASAAQVREKIHTESVNKWQNFKQELQPLIAELTNVGIDPGASRYSSI